MEPRYAYTCQTLENERYDGKSENTQVRYKTRKNSNGQARGQEGI
jgi:hypothetical protein